MFITSYNGLTGLKPSSAPNVLVARSLPDISSNLTVAYPNSPSPPSPSPPSPLAAKPGPGTLSPPYRWRAVRRLGVFDRTDARAGGPESDVPVRAAAVGVDGGDGEGAGEYVAVWVFGGVCGYF